MKRLTGATTLPVNFYEKVQEAIHSTQLKPRMRVEVVDKMWVSAMRVARVAEVYGGRCRLQYEASSVSTTAESAHSNISSSSSILSWAYWRIRLPMKTSRLCLVLLCTARHIRGYCRASGRSG